MHAATKGDRVLAAYAWLVVGLRVVIPVAWIVAAVLAWLYLPPLGGSGQSPLGDIVPSNSAAFSAQERALRLFGSTVLTDTMLVQRNPDGLDEADVAGLVGGARDVSRRQTPTNLRGIRAAAPLVNVPIPGVPWRETNTTAVTYLFLGPELNLLERDETARAFAARYAAYSPGTSEGITGPGPARLVQYEEIDRILPWIEAATVAVILVIVALYFRAVGAPLVTLFTVAIGYVVAIRALAWSGERAGVTVPREIEPILVVLLLGLVTDYTLFFMSDTRRRLARGEKRVPAARDAAVRIVPIVLTAGILVAGGAASLLAGKLEFFRVFGPGLALSALVVTVVCVTLVPALMGLLGDRIFGRAVREATPPPDAEKDEPPPPAPEVSERRARWRMRTSGLRGAYRASRRHGREEDRSALPLFATRVLVSRPVALVVVAVAIATLVVAGSAVRTIDLGVAFVGSLPSDSEPRRAADDAARGFVPGIVSPTDVILEQPGIARRTAQLVRLQQLVAEEPGVALAIGPREQAAIPSVRFAVSRGDGGARIAVVPTHDATEAAGIADFDALRERMPGLLRRAGLGGDVRVSYGGESALAAETVSAISEDFKRIAVAALVVTFVLLAAFLRALVAPLLLLFASALAVVASLGLTALVLQVLVGSSDLIYYVPLVAMVLLVALGSDYNVFIAARIREEARYRRMREAIAVAAPAASRAITVAGITLAATFALLAMVPLRPFRELGLLMALGVLVDALLVRPLLIPALMAVCGELTWWPGRAARPPDTRAFVDDVARRSGLPTPEARRMTRATLTTLGERLPEAQAHELARHLPEGLAVEMEQRDGKGEAFPCDEFVQRVADRGGVSVDSARDDARAVLATLTAALPATEVDYVRAALSDDYRALLDGAGRSGVGGHGR
jgi:putative drug exporter of the RND superfamily